MAKDRAIKNNGTYIFEDFSYGLYLLDTPRTLPYQLGSLALTGGRNIWCEKGALVPQYGYTKKAAIEPSEPIVGVTDSSTANDAFILFTISGVAYYYSANQGLRRYKTTFTDGLDEPLIARRNNDVILCDAGVSYMFGGYYEDATTVPIVNDVAISDFGSFYQFKVNSADAVYFWNGKHVCVDNAHDFIVSSSFYAEGDTQLTVRISYNGASAPVIGATADIGEKTLQEITLTYEPDNTGVDPAVPSTTLDPMLLGVSQNRLFVLHSNGNIYYSAVGVVNDFSQANGAGYFGGFYNDTSQTLAIEEFINGTVITKQNGFYYLTIGDAVQVEKLSQTGQQYAHDHVIVGNKIYAYDTNSGSLVEAATQNVFNSLVAGKTLVASEYLNVQNFNINSTSRFLTYNWENQCLILYYGQNLDQGIIYSIPGQALFPRELDINVQTYVGFNQGVIAVTQSGEIVEDFKKGTIIPGLSAIAEFENIGVRDNRIITCTMLELTELNGVDYRVTTTNDGTAYQKIVPSNNTLQSGQPLPPLLYSETGALADSFELTSRWAESQSNVTRVYAPMSGRNGIAISLEFEAGKTFCLAALRLPDFAQGN